MDLGHLEPSMFLLKPWTSLIRESSFLILECKKEKAGTGNEKECVESHR